MFDAAVVLPRIGALLIVLLALAGTAGPARAACGDKDGIQCRDDLEAANAVVWTPAGFTVAAQMRKGASTVPVLVRFTRDGKYQRTIGLPLPGQPASGRAIVAEPRKLIALPTGGFVIVGELTYTDDESSSGFAMRVSENGQEVWNVPIADNEATIVLHSALYDAQGDKVVLVGRRTNGTDDGRCENWSQGLLVNLNAGDGVEAGKFAFGEAARGPMNRQAYSDVVPGDAPNSFLVAGFGTVPNARTAAKCQDTIVIGRLASQSNTWTFTVLGRIAGREANEVAFALALVGPNTYLLAGHHRDAPDAATAVAYLVNLAPFTVLRPSLSTPFPPDASDKTGGDRYRVILPLAGRGRFLLAGSASTSAASPNRAMWQTVSADLKRVDPPVVFAAPSEIAGAALSPDGRVFAVGRITDEDGRRLGWVGFIGEAPIVVDRRAPDSRLPDVQSLASSNGAYRIPAAALASASGYFGRNLAAGSQTDFAFTLSAPRTLKIAAHTDSGDVDLVVTDRDKRPVAFSNFKSTASEVLVVSLPAGSYTLAVLAQTAVPAYELRFAPAQEMGSSVVAELQQLSEAQRVELARVLKAQGYTPSSEPTIALGAETARALAAAQEGARQPIGPRGIGQVIDRSLGSR